MVALVVSIPTPDETMRGHLAEHVLEHVERSLFVHGAPSPYLAAWETMVRGLIRAGVRIFAERVARTVNERASS